MCTFVGEKKLHLYPRTRRSKQKKLTMTNRIITILLSAIFASNLAAQGIKVVYAGDSVTDGGWGNSAGEAVPTEKRNQWDKNHIYGHSYMMMCAAHYQSTFPENGYEFFNRGISGDDIGRLEARWENDVVRMKPNILSVLVGTNDVHYYLENHTEDFNYQDWGRRYRRLLDRVREGNPNVKFVLGTPFVAKAGWVGESENFVLRDSMIHKLADIVTKIAKDYDAKLLCYDKLFAEQQGKHPSVPMSVWIWDGIHPTAAGHKLMADYWIKECNDIMRVGL